MRFGKHPLTLVVALLLTGCAAPATRLRASTPSSTPSVTATPAFAAATEYERRRFDFETVGKTKSLELVRNHHPASQTEFRKAYRELVHKPDLDRIARAHAGRSMPKVVAVSAGMTLLGAGGFVLLGLPSSGCSKASANCGKGYVSSALFLGAGLYGLGCEIVKGPRCLLDGNLETALLTDDELRRYVVEYNLALAQSLSDAPAPGTRS